MPEILDHHFERALWVDRKALLRTKEKLATQENIPLVVKFGETLQNILGNFQVKILPYLVSYCQLNGKAFCFF